MGGGCLALILTDKVLKETNITIARILISNTIDIIHDFCIHCLYIM